MITEAAALYGVMRDAYKAMVEYGVLVESQHKDGKKNPASQTYNQSLTLYLKILKILGIESVGKANKLKRLTGMEELLKESEDDDDGDGEE